MDHIHNVIKYSVCNIIMDAIELYVYRLDQLFVAERF